MAISPDPRKEDTNKDLDLWWLTQVSMRYLKEKLGKDIQFIAAEHGDQTDIRHINALVLVGGRLTREEFRLLPKLLKQAAAIEAKLQRQMRDPEQAPLYPRQRMQLDTDEPRYAQREEITIRQKTPKPSCPDCGIGQTMWQIDMDLYLCPACGFSTAHNYTLEEQEKGVGLSL